MGDVYFSKLQYALHLLKLVLLLIYFENLNTIKPTICYVCELYVMSRSHTSKHDLIPLTVLLEYSNPMSLIGSHALQTFAKHDFCLAKFYGCQNGLHHN